VFGIDRSFSQDSDLEILANFMWLTSLLAGFVTSALEAGVGEILTARHTGHSSLATLKGYMRSEDPFKGNACERLSL
jgi:hypothetical protein